jgi:hypothetical protein
MEGENRTPDKTIGDIVHAQEQAKRTTGHLPPHGPGTRASDDTRSKPDQGPAKKPGGE